jgi:hypothetical protein
MSISLGSDYDWETEYDEEEEEDINDITDASISLVALRCPKLEYFNFCPKKMVGITDVSVNALIENCPKLKFAAYNAGRSKCGYDFYGCVNISKDAKLRLKKHTDRNNR